MGVVDILEILLDERGARGGGDCCLSVVFSVLWEEEGELCS